jgi:hypothetical protein
MENNVNTLKSLIEKDIVVPMCHTHLNKALYFLGLVELVLGNSKFSPELFLRSISKIIGVSPFSYIS